MVVWFLTLGVLGLRQIAQRAVGVLRAVNPIYIVDFFQTEPAQGVPRRSAASSSSSPAARRCTPTWATSAAGRSQLVWYCLVLPGLLLNYFGQAALLIRDPEAIESPFYRMAPDWAC